MVTGIGIFGDANNEIIAKSHQAYVHKQDCLYGIQLVKNISSQTPIYEL